MVGGKPRSKSRLLHSEKRYLDPARQPVSTRRLRRSISSGRLLDTEEVSLPENDKGIENHIPFVNRIVAWWSRMREKGWTNEATSEQRAALKRDIEPIVRIYNEL